MSTSCCGDAAATINARRSGVIGRTLERSRVPTPSRGPSERVEADRVESGAVESDLEVQVRPSRPTGAAEQADRLASRHRLPGAHIDVVQMCVEVV